MSGTPLNDAHFTCKLYRSSPSDYVIGAISPTFL